MWLPRLDATRNLRVYETPPKLPYLPCRRHVSKASASPPLWPFLLLNGRCPALKGFVCTMEWQAHHYHILDCKCVWCSKKKKRTTLDCPGLMQAETWGIETPQLQRSSLHILSSSVESWHASAIINVPAMQYNTSLHVVHIYPVYS